MRPLIGHPNISAGSNDRKTNCAQKKCDREIVGGQPSLADLPSRRNHAIDPRSRGTACLTKACAHFVHQRNRPILNSGDWRCRLSPSRQARPQRCRQVSLVGGKVRSSGDRPLSPSRPIPRFFKIDRNDLMVDPRFPAPQRMEPIGSWSLS